jgi:hypothetical protein
MNKGDFISTINQHKSDICNIMHQERVLESDHIQSFQLGAFSQLPPGAIEDLFLWRLDMRALLHFFSCNKSLNMICKSNSFWALLAENYNTLGWVAITPFFY